MRPNQPTALRKLFILPQYPLPHTPRLPDKSFLRLWNKTFFTVIYKKIQTFAFKVFRECSENAWASRNGVVQMFFLTPTRNMFAGKFVKGERLLPVLREYIFFNVERVGFRNMS